MSRAAIVDNPLDLTAIVDEVRTDASGAVATFIGTVRNNSDSQDVIGLEYSAYTGMATREMQDIVNEAIALAGGAQVIAVHRIGNLAVGDICVVIAAAHAHRAPAFDACRYAIEQIKKRVPIWKRERYADGSAEWVNARADHGAQAGGHDAAHTAPGDGGL